MLLKFQLDVELNDMVTLPGRKPLQVIEICDSGVVILWDDVRNTEVTVNVYALLKNLLLVERTETYVISPS
jgi:hypothetical protein